MRHIYHSLPLKHLQYAFLFGKIFIKLYEKIGYVTHSQDLIRLFTPAGNVTSLRFNFTDGFDS
jgi:hypothetical protein